MFETIKEFEEYIFSIETDEQLQHAKYGEADVLAYYESLGDRARAQIYKDLSIKSGKESVLNRKYDFQEMAKGFMENLDNLGSFFVSIGEKYWPDIISNQVERYPLVRTILSNYQNLNDADSAMISIVNDIGSRVEAIPKIQDEKFEDMLDELEKNPQTKEIMQKINDAFNGFKIDDENMEEQNSEEIPEEIDPIKASIIDSSWFHKAIEKKFIMGETGKYEWNGTKRELTLFAELMSEKLKIKHKWKTFEVLFNQKNLAQAKDKVSGNFGSGSFGERETEINEIFL